MNINPWLYDTHLSYQFLFVFIKSNLWYLLLYHNFSLLYSLNYSDFLWFLALDYDFKKKPNSIKGYKHILLCFFLAFYTFLSFSNVECKSTDAASLLAMLASPATALSILSILLARHVPPGLEGFSHCPLSTLVHPMHQPS